MGQYCALKGLDNSVPQKLQVPQFEADNSGCGNPKEIPPFLT
jgi:hypothetical protein